MPNSGLNKRSGGRGGKPPVDMSLPPEQRSRRRKGAKTVGRSVTAQSTHATNPKARKKAKKGERRVHQDRYGN